MQSAIEHVKQSTGSNDPNTIRQALNNLQSAAHAMAQHIASRGGAGGPTPGGTDGQGGQGGQGGQAGGGQNVEDAEFEVKS